MYQAMDTDKNTFDLWLCLLNANDASHIKSISIDFYEYASLGGMALYRHYPKKDSSRCPIDFGL